MDKRIPPKVLSYTAAVYSGHTYSKRADKKGLEIFILYRVVKFYVNCSKLRIFNPVVIVVDIFTWVRIVTQQWNFPVTVKFFVEK